MGTGSKELAQRHMKEQSFLTMDDDMTKTYELNIMKSSDILDYETALNIAQSKADDMFKADDSKIPLVTVIDYKWLNAPTTISASLFSEIDEEGNILSLINPQAYVNVAIGDYLLGKLHKDITLINNGSFKIEKDDRNAPYIDNIQMMEFTLILDGDNGKNWDNKLFGDKNSNNSYTLISGIKTYWKDEDIAIYSKNENSYRFGKGSFNNFNHKIKIFNINGNGYLYVDDKYTHTFDSEFDFSIQWYFGSENDDRNIDGMQINDLIYGVTK